MVLAIAPHVLITGGSQGAGKATALKFAAQGWDVTVAARKGDRLNQVAGQIQNYGQKALAVPTDVGNAEQVEALIAKSLDTFGQIDALINNAGICLTGPMTHTSLEDWRQILDTNLWGCIYTIHAALPAMLPRGKGSIVNVGSFGGKMPLPQMTAYCTSKYALTGLTESLRLDYRHRIKPLMAAAYSMGARAGGSARIARSAIAKSLFISGFRSSTPSDRDP